MDNLLFHPKVVHLAIALGVLMPLIAGGILLAWWRRWLPSRTWVVVIALQAILVGSGFVSLQTGEAEEDRVEKVVPESEIETHEEAAEVFVWASVGALALMLLALVLSKGKAGLAVAVAAVVATLVVFVLGYRTGEAGGDLVYRHNAGSAYVGSSVGTADGPGEVGSRTATEPVGGGDDEDDDD